MVTKVPIPNSHGAGASPKAGKRMPGMTIHRMYPYISPERTDRLRNTNLAKMILKRMPKDVWMKKPSTGAVNPLAISPVRIALPINLYIFIRESLNRLDNIITKPAVTAPRAPTKIEFKGSKLPSSRFKVSSHLPSSDFPEPTEV